MEKIDISSMTLPRLTEWVTGTLGEPKFRAGQIYRWIHQKRVGSFTEMTNLSTALRQKLEERAFLTVLTTRRRLESKLDETVKLLLELPDQKEQDKVKSPEELEVEDEAAAQAEKKQEEEAAAEGETGENTGFTPLSQDNLKHMEPPADS